MSRARPPNRRQGDRDFVRWPPEGSDREPGRRIHVTANFADATGKMYETFLRGGGRVGTDVDFLLDDVAVLISRGLQHGDTAAAMADGVSRGIHGEATSVVGVILDKLVEIERKRNAE